MVQFAASRHFRTPRDYWMLYRVDRYEAEALRTKLRARNYGTSKTTSVSRLRALLVRCQRGLLSYDGLPLRELRLYAAQRGLPLPRGKKNTVKTLKAQLEQADDENTFERFSDLPPELRQIIYSLYFKSLDDSRSWPSDKYQPPLTLTSRNIRQESLPLFYECCDFKVTMNAAGLVNIRKDFTTALATGSSAFFSNCSPQNFARVKVLVINIVGWDITLRLDLTNTENLISVMWCFYSVYCVDSGLRPAQLERKSRLLQELHKAASDITARRGPLKLRKSDLKMLYETIWEILWEG